MVQDQKPSIVFKDENIRRISLGTAHRFIVGHRHVFEACDPGDGSLDFDGYFRNVDPHVGRVTENPFPACPDVFPSRQTDGAGVNADGTRIGGPYLIHEIDVEAFEREVELEICLHHLFGISH